MHESKVLSIHNIHVNAAFRRCSVLTFEWDHPTGIFRASLQLMQTSSR